MLPVPTLPWYAAFPLGVAVGAFGTLIGAGGGFLLLPILVLADPATPPGILAAVSLAVVCANAMSGTYAYARLGRVDVRSAIAFAAAGVPGSVLGALATRALDRRVFDPLLGGVLLLAAATLVLFPARQTVPPLTGGRVLVESDGTTHHYAPRLGRGIAISVLAGFLSSLLGIGGGILHVPLMVHVLGFPVHVATATSHAVLAAVALAGTITHLFDGTLRDGAALALPLIAGVLVGAPLGARASGRWSGERILRGLAIALALVGFRLLVWR